MAAATLTITLTIPDTTGAAYPDDAARRIAVEALQQVAHGVGAPGAATGSTTHMVAYGNTITVANWTWTPPA